MKAYKRTGGKTPLIFNLGTRSTWVANFVPSAALPLGKNRGTQWLRGWVGTQRRYGREEQKSLTPTGIRTPDRSSRSLIAIPTTLSRFELPLEDVPERDHVRIDFLLS